MKKVIIIGCPGSGKSTFGRRLCAITHLPLYHLDMMYWIKDKTTVPREVFLAKLCEVMKNDKWVIDGNYASTMEMRFREADTVVFLDYPTELCIDGLKSRKGKPRPDMPWIEIGEDDEEFISFVRNYNKDQRNKVLQLIEKYSDKNIMIFHTREESEEFLNKIEKTKPEN